MMKAKRPRLQHGQAQGNNNSNSNSNKKHRKMRTFEKVSNTFSKEKRKDSNKAQHPPTQRKPGPKPNPGHQQQRRPVVPFGRKDRILLIGEGDFSFARSLVTRHRCRNVLATSYDSKETLYGKYPQVQTHIDDILATFHAKGDGIKNAEEVEEEDSTCGNPTVNEKSKKQQHRKGAGVLFSVDARKLGLPAGGGKEVRLGFPQKERKRPAWQEAEARKKSQGPSKDAGSGAGGPWDVICFNFPHVGGISTDVNRQVRANQELLVTFFKACVPLLSARPEPADYEEDGWEYNTDSASESDGEDDETEGVDDGAVLAKRERRTEPGQILVSLFEGEPYTLWNIKDLARHAGLRVVTSFKFPWKCYAGYSHARTLGEIEGKDGGRGGWRGEDRDARMYVFELKQDGNNPRSPLVKAGGKGKKRSAETDESDSD